MADMPIPQDFGRHIDGMPIQENDDGSATVDLPDELSDVQELPDGSAIVQMDDHFKGPADDEDFYSNLAETMNTWDMEGLALKYLDFIDKDKEAREKRDKQYEEGIRRTGMGDDAPGGATFMGASKVVHPVMAEACVDFASRAIKELFPPDGPVKSKILGDVTDDKEEIAERKVDWVNWQLTEQIEEFRDETEQLLTQLPLGGSQFLKLWYDEKKKRPCAEFVPIDNVILPFASVNFYTAQRVTEKQEITQFEYDQRVARGLYRDVDLVRATAEPDQTHSEKASEKIEGKKYIDNIDGLRTVYHIYTWLDLEEDDRTKGESAPYILMIDELDNKVLGIYRNWEEGDDTFSKLDWLIEFKFIPWRGAYAIGLPHLIGGLSAALTGALRALLDTAHVNNSLTMLKLKGAKISGQSQQVEITQVTEIEGAPGVDDIRKIAMPMPFNPPSPVLFELLGWLNDAAKGVVSTAEEKISEATNNMPVGTAQALIEQGSQVYSGIHTRLHNSMRRVLMVLGRINRWYLDDQRRGDVVKDLPIAKADFNRNSDIVPVSDPHIFSETQRMAQTQAVMAMMTQFPQSFDQNAVLARMLKQMKVPNVNELMPKTSQPTEMDAADENAAMALGKAAFAYPRQDQLAHIQTHLMFALDPALGGNPIMAPQFIPQALEHIKQHMLLWYTSQMKTYVTGGNNLDLGKYETNKLASEVDKAFSLASQHVGRDTQQVFAKVLPAIQQLGQMASQMAQQAQQAQPTDPEAQAVLQASMAETQRRAAKDKADIAIDMKSMANEQARDYAKQQVDIAMNAENNLTQERMKSAQLTVDEAKLRREQEATAQALENRTQHNLGS